MSGKNGVINPDVAWVGESPDHDGVVAVIDPGTRNQVVLCMRPLAAVALGQQLILSGAAANLPQDPQFDSRCSVIVRMRPEQLDS